MTYKLILPDGVALHTAGEKRDQEYGWFIEKGDIEILDTIKNLHRSLLRDVGGESPRLAILVQKQRLGFFIGDMSSPRRDYYGNRIIQDTLYLEYKDKSKVNVLNYVANLLLCSNEQYEKIREDFTRFAESLYKQPDELPDLPSLTETSIQDCKEITSDKSALYNNSLNRQRCAIYLREKAVKSDSFCCVVTGRVSVERCEQAVLENKDIKEFLILTLASEMEKKGEIPLDKISWKIKWL
ncbi:MAG: hypothetical protein BWK79_14905, partial [Beggiatoa sp. IS2]